MDLEPGNATSNALMSMPPGAVEESLPIRPDGTTILALAAWIGLIAGFLDLAFLVVNRKLIKDDFYRVGSDFAWLIPTGVTILILVPAIMLILIAQARRRPVRLGLATGLLSFVGHFDMPARLPLDMWASLLLSCGLAVQSSRLVVRHRQLFLRFVHRTLPLLAGTLLIVMLVTVSRRAWTEHRAAAAVPPAPAGARNVILIVWDTVRASNLSAYGYNRRTTPNLEQLARRGVRFDPAFSTSSWTLPAHASLFTGRWPHELGVDWKSPLRDDVPTLAEYLAAHGYDTAGFAANLDYCTREGGLARGFAHYEDFPINLYELFARYVALGNRLEIVDWAGILGRMLEKVSGRSFEKLIPQSREHAKNAASIDMAFLKWLSSRQPSERPFFAFLNYNDAHTPYEVPDQSVPGFGSRPTSSLDRLMLFGWNAADKAKLEYKYVRMAIDVYDDCIAYLDRRLGILLNDLDRRGVLDDTLVIVTADHGEHLGDHLLFFHGNSLYRQLVQVPLVIVDPKTTPANRLVVEPVSLRDVPATILDLLSLRQDTPFPGRSLARFWSADPPPAEPLLMETNKLLLLTNQGREPAAKGPMKSLVAGGMHYIRSADGLEELYALRSDPEEQFNTATSPITRAILQEFRERLAAMLRKP